MIIDEKIMKYLRRINNINIKPIKPYKLNKSIANEYINLQPNDESKFFARLALKLTKHVTFRTFYNNLLYSINIFNENINDNCCLIINDIDELPSDLWVFLLIYDKLSKNVTEIRTEHNNIKNILLIDDAMYSGMHIANNIYKIVMLSNNIFNFHIVTPYVTYDSINYIKSLYKKHNISFYYKCIMKPVKELMLKPFMIKYNLTKKNAKKLITKIAESYGIDEELNPVAIYFDHKIPDEFSSICNIYLGVISNYNTKNDLVIFKPLIDNITYNTKNKIVAFYKNIFD